MPPNSSSIGTDGDGTQWAVHHPSGDVFFKNAGSDKWTFGANADVWDRRGRDSIFGERAKATRIAELEAREPFLAKQRKAQSSTTRSLFGGPPAPRVDASIRVDPQLDNLMKRRRHKPTKGEERRTLIGKMYENTRNFLGYAENIKDLPEFRNNLRLRQQDFIDAMDKGDVAVHNVIEPLRNESSMLEMFRKLVGLQDMRERSTMTQGSPAEITQLQNQIKRLTTRAATASGGAQKKLLAKIARKSNQLTHALSPQPQPLGRTTAQLDRAINDLMSRAPAEVHQALQRHRQLMWSYAIEGVKRGQLPPAVLSRGTYYPHHVIESANQVAALFPEKLKTLREPYRPWTQRAHGSERWIDFEYEDVMRRHIMRTEMANKMDDFAATNLPLIDRLDELRKNPAEWARVFGRTDGTIPTESELGVRKVYNYDGEEYVLYRYNRHQFVMPPKSALHANALAALQGSEGKTFFIPRRAADYLTTESWSADAQMMQQAMGNFVTWWKATQITTGGVGTRVVNSFGDLFQAYMEDLPALLNNVWKAPQIARILRGKNLSAQEQRIADLLKKHRVTEGSTFFGLGSVELARARRARQLAGGSRFAPSQWGQFPRQLDALNAVMEVWPRVAKALTDLDRIAAGKQLKSKVFDIEGLSKEAAMGVLARNTFVDYQAVSPGYQKYLRRWHMPFITWFHRTFGYTGKYLMKNKLEATVKLGLPALGAWVWNNMLHPDEERNQRPWVKHFLLHWTLPLKDAQGNNLTLVLPQGTDTFMDVAQIPVIAESFGRWARGDIPQPMQWEGWSTPVKLTFDILKSLGSELVELTPITQAFWSIGKNRDWRSGQPVVPDHAWDDPRARTLWQTKYLAFKALPILDRIVQYWEKDAARPGGLTTGTAPRYLEAALEGWFNPTRSMLYGIDLSEERRYNDAIRKYEAQQDRGLYEMEEAFTAEMSGTPGAMAEWAQKWGSKVSPEAAANRIESLRTLSRIMAERNAAARTPEERERTRIQLQQLKKAGRWQRLQKLPKDVGNQFWLEEALRRQGRPVMPPESGLFGEPLAE